MQHTRIFFFFKHIYIYIKYKNHKINTRKKKRYYSFFFKGWVQLSPCGWSEPSRPSWVPGPNQWPGWAQRHASFLTRALAGHCSSELNFTWTVTHTTKKCMQKLNNRPGERWRSCSDVEGVLFGLSVFVCSSPFPLFSVFVCLLRLALCLRPFFSTCFSFDFLFFPSSLFCRSIAGNGA